jgi:hypothetical protein
MCAYVLGATEMKQFHSILLAFAVGLTVSVAAHAQSSQPAITPSAAPAESTQIPEPGDVALFLLGVTGLVVGRWSSRGRKKRTDP